MTCFTNATRGVVLAERGVLGVSFWLRLRGLMFRREFAPFDGLWLAPASAIHMFWVRFAIDLVWLDGGLRVAALTPGVRPWRMAQARGASSVLELPEGTIARSGTKVGDAVVFGAVEGGRRD